MAHIRKCTLCKSEYDYCPRCDTTKPTFYLKYCSENCKDISEVLNKYYFKHLTKEQAAMELMKLNVDVSKYGATTVALVADIMSAVKEPEPVVEEAPIVEEAPVEEEVIKEEPKKEKAQVRYRKPAVKRK